MNADFVTKEMVKSMFDRVDDKLGRIQADNVVITTEIRDLTKHIKNGLTSKLSEISTLVAVHEEKHEGHSRSAGRIWKGIVLIIVMIIGSSLALWLK